MDKTQKQNSLNCKGNISCGCGCVTVLMQMVALIIVCFILGCEWAKNVVKRVVGDVSEIVSYCEHSQEGKTSN